MLWRANGRTSDVLRLDHLDSTNPGISPGVAAALAEAARVCLDRDHSSPAAFDIHFDTSPIEMLAHWEKADERLRMAWANENYTTELGAYCLALSAFSRAGFIVVSRAETDTGADFLLALRGTRSHRLEACLRIEISGVSDGSWASIRHRLKQKVRQAFRGKSSIPAVACVVAFRARVILTRDVPLK